MAPKVDQLVVAEILRLHATGITNSEIARQTGRKRQYVDFHLQKNGRLPNRSPEFALQDVGCMDRIDTWGKAYSLGFIAADGCVSERSVEILIQQQDVAVLEYIRTQLGSTAKIETRNDGRHVRLRLNSLDLVKAMATHGITARKSLTHQWPTTVPDEFLWAFVLGYFDGDGSVAIYHMTRSLPSGNRGDVCRPAVCVVCSWSFAESLQGFLTTSGVPVTIVSGCVSHSVAKVVTNSWGRASHWLELMYRDAEFCLARKKLIADQIFEYVARPDSRVVLE